MGALIEFTRALPRWVETTFVVTLGFGLFIYASLSEAAAPSSMPPAAADFLYLAGYEIVVGALLLAFLFLRGWRLGDLGFAPPALWEPAQAVLLLLTVVFGGQFLWALAEPHVSQDAAPAMMAAGDIGWGSAVAFSFFNAAYEELFVCAYIVAALRGGVGVSTAILASAVLRLSYHIYQGPLAFVMIGPFGLLFAWYFAVRGRVMPLIAVHVALDMLALLPYVRS